MNAGHQVFILTSYTNVQYSGHYHVILIPSVVSRQYFRIN